MRVWIGSSQTAYNEQKMLRKDVMRFPLVLLGLCLGTQVQAQDRLVGTWQGHWFRAGDSMLVTLHVRRDPSTGRHAATFDADRLRVSGIPFNEVELQGCCDLTMTLRGDRTTAVFTGRLQRDSLTGVLQEESSQGRFAYARAQPAGPQFVEREITFANDGVTLAGTLLLPRTGASLAAVVFLHGSGAEGRWASRFLAAQFANQGVAVLIFDKRGVGGSSGDWRRATPEELAADGVAAVARLRQEPRIDGARIGVHGHSQGGTLAPLVAIRARAAFVIGSAAAGVPTDSTEIFSILNAVYPAATSAEDSANARVDTSALVAAAYHRQSRARLDSLAAALRDRPWFFAPPPPDNAYWSFSPLFAQYRPLEWWSRVRVPVLLVYGADDQRVPATESAQRIAATLRSAGNTNVTVRIYAGADHTFRMRPGPSGWPDTAPDYVRDLLNWVANR
ncbi:MAG TPA: alpha/beta fold hydrolase [Longimicrobiales bacterium]|nr:alpha/beta fold hydrolase [Longimicrobiales bacterium]